jgi:transposase-like protein
MGIRRTKEFRSEAVRIALTSGLSLKQVSADLGIGLSTLGKWIYSAIKFLHRWHTMPTSWLTSNPG